MSAALSLKPSYYEALKRLTIELVGVKLGSEHAFLVETRLSALARKEGFETLSQMIDELFSRGQTRLAIHVVTALLERSNQFFEDRAGFETLGDIILPDLNSQYRGDTVKILSFGCSSGQEIYSTSILADLMASAVPDIEIALTGIDYPSDALERARTGRFTHFEVQRGLPIRHLIKYFDRDGEDWTVKENLRKKITFADHNLMANFSELGNYHIVMFRGKLAQYTKHARTRMLRGLNKLVSPNGYLMLGSDEVLEETDFWFKGQAIAPGCYKKPAIQLEEEPEPKPTFIPEEYKGNSAA